MPGHRFAASLLVVLALGGVVHAQNVALVEPSLTKVCLRIDLRMDLIGDIRVQQDGKPVSIKQTAKARHEYLERVLEAKSDVAAKTARFYETAEAAITVDQETSARKLRRTRALMLAQANKDGILVYSPKGLLTQDELELTEHLDTLHVSGLLPGKEVATGDSWKIGNHVVLALCDLEGLIEHNLSGKLIEVKSDVAHLSFVGKVKGIHLGAEATMIIEAKGQFDLKEKRLVGLVWKQTEQRMQGPVNPALSAEVTYTLTRTSISEPAELGDIALVPALAVAADTVSSIRHTDAKGRFEFQHSRDWHLVSEQEKHLVFRLVDRGDFVAQATLMPMKKSPDKMMTLEEFVELMVDAPGWKHEELIDKTDKVEVGGGVKVYRVAATGELEGVKAVQYFYLLHGQLGDQMIVTFTMAPNQVRNLDARDMTILRGITLPRKE